MSVRAMAWAFEQRVGNPLRKLVLAKIADHHNDDTRESYPSEATIAADCDMTERSVRRSFEEQGLLASFKRGRHKVYRLAILTPTLEGNSDDAAPTPESLSTTPERDFTEPSITDSNRQRSGGESTQAR